MFEGSSHARLEVVPADAKPQAAVLRELNLNANAARRAQSILPDRSRAQPLRLVRRIVGQG